jgi:type II secretory pathway component PulK
MSRRGFALITVLWVITTLSVLTGAGLVVARIGSTTTRNRVLLARAEWAREACGEILQARFAHNAAIREVTTVELGRRTWCRAGLDDPAARINLNTVDRESLALLVASVRVSRTFVDAVIARRRQDVIYDLREVSGVDSIVLSRLGPFVTTRGTGVINVNAAPPEVLRLLLGVTEEAVAVIMSRRTTRPLQNADELAGALSRSSRAALLTSYAEFVRSAVFAPPQLIVTLEGGVHGTTLIARATLTAVSVPGRLAVVRREVE